MAKHLKPADIEAIVEIIRGWPTEKLTWDVIREEAAKVIGKAPSRPTLNAHTLIKEAYSAKKNGLKVHGSRRAMPSSLAVASVRIASLVAEIDELKKKNVALLEQFVRWQYNAHARGVKEHHLNAEIPYVDRERTDG